MTESILMESALEYSEKFNYPVFPINPSNKKPLLEWKQFQTRKATKKEIKEWWTKWPRAMIAGATGKFSGDFTVDIDSPAGQEAIEHYIPDSLITPTSQSPSGGYHLHFQYPGRGITIKARFLPDVDYRGEGGYIILPPSINNDGKTYVWREALGLRDCSLACVPAALEQYIINTLYSTKGGYRGDYRGEKIEGTKLFEEGTKDEDLFHVSWIMTKGGAKNWEIWQVLERLILSWGENPDSNWINAKIKSALDRIERRDFIVADEVWKWISVTDGDFSVTECDKALQSVTGVTNRDIKATIRQAIHRLKADGKLEKVGRKDGIYRRISEDSEVIDFANAEENVLDIRFPLEVDKLVEISDKNVIVIAGSKDAGKTAFMFNFVWMNMERWKIRYFSSEMGAKEAKKRLIKFGYDISKWKFELRSMPQGYIRNILPDDINIIDFLEIYDEFYKVGAEIREIFDRLNRGIALIALQKNPGTDFGLGGQRSIEKARLYLALESGVAKIVSGKNWASTVNPRGLVRPYKIHQGAVMQACGEWENKDPKKIERRSWHEREDL